MRMSIIALFAAASLSATAASAQSSPPAATPSMNTKGISSSEFKQLNDLRDRFQALMIAESIENQNFCADWASMAHVRSVDNVYRFAYGAAYTAKFHGAYGIVAAVGAMDQLMQDADTTRWCKSKLESDLPQSVMGSNN